jgi:hypothetical protein
MKPTLSAERFLRRQRRQAQAAPLAWGAAAAVSAGCWLDAVRLAWVSADARWAWLAIGGSAALLGIGIYRLGWLKLAEVARENDRRWMLKARLETVAELDADASPIALLQRRDAAAHLATRRPPGLPSLLAGLAALTVVGVLLGWEYRALHPSVPVAATTAGTPSTSAVSLPAAPPAASPIIPKATIAWTSPAANISARATETVKLLAAIDANYALPPISLQVMVNGRLVSSYPVAAPTAGGTVQTQLFLDETGARPHDLVSYQLQIPVWPGPPAAAAVASAIQSIEILSTAAGPLGRTPVGKLLPGVARLAAAQRELWQRTRAQIESHRGTPTPAWSTRNGELSAAQAALQQQVQPQQAAVGNDSPAVQSDLAQARSAIDRAAAALRGDSPDAAQAAQSDALDALTAAQRDLEAAATSRPPVSGVLAPRATTPAGKLEQLSQQQTALSREVAAQSKAAANTAALSDREAAVLSELQQLQQSAEPPSPEVGAKLAEASDAAARASRQLSVNDPQAATLPAAQAAAALQSAVSTQEQQGRESAAAALHEARQELNQNQNPSADQLADVQRQLQTEAQRQQRQGSAQAAQQLQSVAQQLTASDQSVPSESAAQQASLAQTQTQQSPPSQSVQESPAQSSSSASNQQSTDSSPSQQQDKSDSSAAKKSSSDKQPSPSNQPGNQPSQSGKPSQAGASTSSSQSGQSPTQAQTPPRSGAAQQAGQSQPQQGQPPSPQPASSGKQSSPQEQQQSSPSPSQQDISGNGSNGSSSGSQPSSANRPGSQPSHSGKPSQAASSPSSGQSPGQAQSQQHSEPTPQASQSQPQQKQSPSSQPSSSGTQSSEQNQQRSKPSQPQQNKSGNGPPGSSSGSQPSSGNQPSSSSQAGGQPQNTPSGGDSGRHGVQSDSGVVNLAALLASTETKLAPDAALRGAIDTLRDLPPQLDLHLTAEQQQRFLAHLLTADQTAWQSSRYFAAVPSAIGPASHQVEAFDRRLQRLRNLALSGHGIGNELNQLTTEARELANTLEKMRASGQRDEWQQQFNPDAIDPEYRDSIEHYFERLSRRPSS